MLAPRVSFLFRDFNSTPYFSLISPPVRVLVPKLTSEQVDRAKKLLLLNCMEATQKAAQAGGNGSNRGGSNYRGRGGYRGRGRGRSRGRGRGR